MIEYARTGPRQCERGEEQHVREIDRYEIGRCAVHAEQDDRGCTQQIGKTPPRHGIDRRVLHPGEQQEQSEDRFHIDRDQEQRVDVKIHRQQPHRTDTEIESWQPRSPKPIFPGGKNE
jgi:hypothetical protein